MANNENGEPAAVPAPESNEALLAHLARLSGRSIRSRDDITAYVDELLRKSGERRAKSQHLKNFLLVLLLVVSAAQYYFIDVQLQILAQPSLTVFVPTKGDAAPQRPYI